MPEHTSAILRAQDRFRTRNEAEGKDTWHSFSFGNHYDPERINFGPIMAINEEHLAAGAGYEPHLHRDVDILTWVISGSLAHEDSTGFGGTITPGTLQHLNAGSGVTHSEMNATQTEPLVFVQMMVRADAEADTKISEEKVPHYGQTRIPDLPGLHPGPAVEADAEVFIARLNADTAIELPAAKAHLVHLTRGTLTIDGVDLVAGDQWQSTTGQTHVPLTLATTSETAEAILWLVHYAISR